ncbi:zinc knuckle CX2CX4HX4C containing protein [Tanacetum coccineum]
MEADFLLGKEASKKPGLAAKVKNIEGKPLGKDGKPLKSILKCGNVNPNQVMPDGGSCLNHKGVVPDTNGVKPLGLMLDTKRGDAVFTQNTPKKVQVLVLTNDENVLGANVAIPMHVVDEIYEKFVNTLSGYVIGERLAFPIVEGYVKNSWAKYGFERAIIRNGFFLFKFSSHEGMVKFIKVGPWFIRSIPIFLNFWTANTKLEREKITRVPVWVKIHNVPVVAFSETRLSLISTQLGRPIQLDACTSDMCLNPWGRNTYARVLVKLSSKSAIVESIVAAIPLPKARESGSSKGVNKAASSKQKEGFRFSKPKKNLIYRPVSKPTNKKVDTSTKNANLPSTKEVANGVVEQPNVPLKLRSAFGKLMEENKVLDVITTNESDGAIGTLSSLPKTKEILTSTNKVPVEVKGNNKGSLLEQFLESCDASSSKQNSMSNSDESKVEEVCMPDYIPGGVFLNDLEDDLDCFDGYEAQFYDLTKQRASIL